LQPCVWDYIIIKKRENKCVAERRRNCINGVCDKNVVDWASNDFDSTTIEGCKYYQRKNDSFIERCT
jgi:hypothetical protein